VIADSAEPKSIAEMQEYGLNVIGAQKGPGSRNQGIQYVQDQRMSVTKRSTNIIKSYRNYMWKTDKDGHVVDIPDHAFSDEMDAVRYAMESMRPNEDEDKIYTSGNLTKLWA
jgi:phage terminase large subunit